MNLVEIYISARSEIISNHVLMHWFSIIVAAMLLAGVFIVEKHEKTILSVFLPLLSVAWAAAIVRFDFFIHRQAAYLRELEAKMTESGVPYSLWETWKASSRATPVVVPLADLIASTVIVIPTIYLLFGPAQRFFEGKGWKGKRAFAWSVTILMALLLSSLAAIPKIAAYR
ncbi:MAG TPA: hypothetical protein VFH96_02605 [Pyrinomonadaceae bacterium]|nr:hypothetical protein [Pyrinomonadaceae bacterium]